MTQAQDHLYWREWGYVVRHCRKHKLPEPDRHQAHCAALGADKSHKDFTNGEFDRVLAQFRAHSQPDNLAAQLRQANMPKTRLLYSIRKRAPEAYWRSIARDKFGTDDIGLLEESQLTQLRNTLEARANARRHKQPAMDTPF